MKKLTFILAFFPLLFLLFFMPNFVYAQLETKITASDGAEMDFLGCSVSISRNYIAIGAGGDDDYTGSVYIFKYHKNNWIEQAKLIASDGAPGDAFGARVSISGDYVAIGAFMDDDSIGSTYIFQYNGTSWIEQSKLIASDGVPLDFFGWSVSMSGDYVAIGAHGDDDYTGSVYIFKRDGTSWIEQAKLIASDGATGDVFGYSVYISGDYVVIGADGDDEARGSAYIFKLGGTNWIEQAKLIASDGAAEDYFGHSVSISGDYVVIGAGGDDERRGSAYIFKRIGKNWIEQAKLIASDGIAEDFFGASVSVSGDYAIVGVPGDDDNGINSGSAYLYDLSLRPLKLEPQILSIKDVSHDQGGRVTMKWEKSSLDNGTDSLSFYSIWRALPEGTVSNKSANFITDITKDFAGPACRFFSFNSNKYAWEWLANLPGYGFSLYAYTAATLYDSMSTTDGKHYFLVLAHTIDPHIFYVSNVDSGYSVDNLAPLPPSSLMATVVKDQVELAWNESQEADLCCYVLYRDGIRYDSTSSTRYIDTHVEIGQSYSYQLTAVDVHENESELSEEASSGPVPVELTSFTAAENLTIKLTWVTATETNNFGFRIERRPESNNEGGWQEIGFVEGHGTTAAPHQYQYIDKLNNADLILSHIFQYRLKQIDTDGSFSYSQVITVKIELPQVYQLSQNYPNPFNATTTISFTVPRQALVMLKVYDLMGREVTTLVNNDLGPGFYQVDFDASDISCGLYYYRFETSEFKQIKKLLVLK